MINSIHSVDAFQNKIHNEAASLFYFSHEQCNVCKVLKPKIENLLIERFPEIKMYYIDTVNNPELAAQQSIFAVPTLAVYFDGKEFIRKSRNIGIEELAVLLERPYELLFGK